MRDFVADWKKWSRAERVLAVMVTLLVAPCRSDCWSQARPPRSIGLLAICLSSGGNGRLCEALAEQKSPQDRLAIGRGQMNLFHPHIAPVLAATTSLAACVAPPTAATIPVAPGIAGNRRRSFFD